MIINATSIGLNKDDEFKIDFKKVGTDKFFMMLFTNLTKQNFQAGDKSKIFMKMVLTCLYFRQKKHLIYGIVLSLK